MRIRGLSKIFCVSILLFVGSVHSTAQQDPAFNRIKELAKEFTRESAFFQHPDMLRENIEHLMRQYDVTEQDIIHYLRTHSLEGGVWPPSLLAWQIALLMEFDSVHEEFCRMLFEGEWKRNDKRGTICSQISENRLAGEKLSQTLLPYLQQANLIKFRTYSPLDLLFAHPIPEAVPIFRTLLIGKDTYSLDARKAAESLAKLQTAQAFTALAEALAERPSYPAAAAIASYGDDAIKFLAKAPPPIGLSGLEHLATPLAVEAAEELCNWDDPNSVNSLMRVKFAAGEPYRTEALLEALNSDSEYRIETALGTIQSARCDTCFGEKIKKEVTRHALLGNNRISRDAVYVLQGWHRVRHFREKQLGTIWGDETGGISIGVVECSYSSRRFIYCDMILRNESGTPLRLRLQPELWQAILPDDSPLQIKSYQSSARTTVWLEPGKETATRAGFQAELTDQDVQHVSLRLKLTVRAEDYRGPIGWVGSVITPEIHMAVPPRQDKISNFHRTETLDGDMLSYWIAFLARGRESGHLGEHCSISVYYSEDVPRSLMLQNNAINPNRIDKPMRIWLAIPGDLLVLQPQEVSSICSYLLKDGNFIDPIQYFDNHGKYMPRAEIVLQTPTRAVGWGQFHFKKDFWEGWCEVMDEILQPRLKKARKQLELE